MRRRDGKPVSLIAPRCVSRCRNEVLGMSKSPCGSCGCVVFEGKNEAMLVEAIRGSEHDNKKK